MKIPSVDRLTITLPHGLVHDIDRHEKNRSRFVTEAVRHELDRRRRLELQKSLENPHSETADLNAQGFGDWAQSLPDEHADELVDCAAGTPVQWISGKGWLETDR